jgi:L-rhamnose mutarotase
MKRFGQLIGLRPEVYEEYVRIHAAVWPEILEAIRKAGIRNYSIFHFEGKLFAYYGDWWANMKEVFHTD